MKELRSFIGYILNIQDINLIENILDFNLPSFYAKWLNEYPQKIWSPSARRFS